MHHEHQNHHDEMKHSTMNHQKHTGCSSHAMSFQNCIEINFWFDFLKTTTTLGYIMVCALVFGMSLCFYVYLKYRASLDTFVVSKRRKSSFFMYRLLEAAVSTSDFMLSMLLMLAVMSYNYGIVFCVLLGCFLVNYIIRP